MNNLGDLRDKINKLDSKLVTLINERAALAQEIGKIKKNQNKEIFSAARELDVYTKVLAENKGPLSADSLKAIYREIMSGAKALEKELKIGYLGPKATFTHQAAMSNFGASVTYLSLDTIKDVFLSVEKGESDYGVVPVENSTGGLVSYTLDTFMESDLKICAEIILKISHNLLSNDKAEQITKIYSKAPVFNQCRLFLRNYFPKAELIDVSSTTKAATITVKEKGAAAIASFAAADLYGLKILHESIEDSPGNVTRFLVIGKNYSAKAKKNKTSVVFSIKDKVGALYDTMQPFKKSKINLTKIESRPSKRKAWEYYFFVDFLGHCEDKKVKDVLNEIEKHCLFMKILGSYPPAQQ